MQVHTFGNLAFRTKEREMKKSKRETGGKSPK
jgi:hypothetical protein